MKTEIFISGQVGSKFKLRNAIISGDCVETKGLFNSITLTFPTRKAAYKALSVANKYLKMCGEKTNYAAEMSLSYDAATAKIIK